MIKKYKGDLTLVFVAIIWGSGFIASEFALYSLDPLQILFIRFSIATLIMTLVSLKRLKNLNKKLLTHGIILGVFLFTGFALQTFGLQYTTPSKNAFLTATNVVIVPFIAFVIYKKKVDKYSFFGAVLALAGIWLLSMKGDFTMSLGDFLTLMCAIAFALQIFFTGEFVKTGDFMALTTIQMMTAAFLSFIMLIIFGGFDFQASRQSLLSAFYLGIFSTSLAYFLQTWAQKYTSETKTAIILSTESIFGTIFSVIIIKEVLTGKMLLGCILILSGVLLSEIKPGNKKLLN